MGFYDNAGVTDGKVARQEILQKANVILTGLLNNLASNYVTSNAFSFFAVQLKALAFEAARIISISEDVYNDLIFTTTRPEFISQNIESFLFYNQRFSHFDQTDVQVRSFLLALIQAYFRGATAASIEAALVFEFNQQSGQISFTLTEPIYQEYSAPGIDFVRLQHQFTVAINVGNSNTDIVTLQEEVEFVVNLIKPAHTLLTTQFIFLEPQNNTDSLGNINCILIYLPDGQPLIDQYGFQVTQKVGTRGICDTFQLQIFDYGYEDARFDCLATTQLQALLETADLLNSTTIKTRYGPISDGNGNLISNVNQLTVLVNGNQVAVQSVNGILGLVTLVNPVPDGASVQITYSWLRRYFDTMVLNNTTTLLNQFDAYNDTLPGFRYSTLIWSPTPALPNVSPITCQYAYSGFDALDSSLLNDPTTLVFNEVSNRDKLNDYSVWYSTNYASGDTVTLNEGEALFPLSQEVTLTVQDTTQTVFRLNDVLSVMNSMFYSMLGTTTLYQIRPSEIPQVYAGLDVTSTCSEGIPDRLKPMCEDGLNLFFGDITTPFSDTYAGIQNEAGSLFITNTTGSVITVSGANYPTLYGPNGPVTQWTLGLGWYPDSINDNTPGVTGEVYAGATDDWIPPSISGFPSSGYIPATISLFEVDYQSYVSGYFLLNTTSYVLNATGDLLPPFPREIVTDELLENTLGQFFEDSFVMSGFCLNDSDSILNTPFSSMSGAIFTDNPAGIIGDHPPGYNSGPVADYLLEFILSGVAAPYEDQYPGANDFLNETEFRFHDAYSLGSIYLSPMFGVTFSPFNDILENLEFLFQDKYSHGPVYVSPMFGITFSPFNDILLSVELFNTQLMFDDSYSFGSVYVSPMFGVTFSPFNDILVSDYLSSGFMLPEYKVMDSTHEAFPAYVEKPQESLDIDPDLIANFEPINAMLGDISFTGISG